MSRFFLNAVILMFIAMPSIPLAAEWEFDIESGIVSAGLNNIQIPNETGTRFSLVNDLKTDVHVFWRARISCLFQHKHTLSLLLAPLTLKADDVIDRDILYNGVIFPAGEHLDTDYTFNSYRLTYRYRLVDNKHVIFGLGFTGKIRDAAVKLSGDTQSTEYTNVGFVPLVNFKLQYRVSPHVSFLLDGDALAAPGGQGRAEDISATLAYDMGKRLTWRIGYRVLEGGADVKDVYSFALLHYAAAGLTIKF